MKSNRRLEELIIVLIALISGFKYFDQTNSSMVDIVQNNDDMNLLRIVPMEGKSFGANVYGFDPQLALRDGSIVSQVKTALENHLVLFFHNVSDKLTPEMHVELARKFGPVDPRLSAPPKYLTQGKFNSPEAMKRAIANGAKLEDLGNTMLKANQDSNFPKEITRIVKEPKDLIAFGEGWHSDLTFHKAPPMGAVLVSRENPKKGGNTHFLDMRAAYERLPTSLKLGLETLVGNHTDGHSISNLHPVIRNDNKFGRQALFVNKAFVRNLIGNSSDDKLLEKLFHFIETMPETNPDAFLNLDWTSGGKMAMWDNRFTQHSANADYTEKREMHRVVLSGTVPF